MVQDPTCLNDIEATVYRLKLENIGLRIFDVFQPELARFSLGIAETAQEFKSMASTREPGNCRAVSIECCPVPQPAMRISAPFVPTTF